jgi:hypothetical protein
LALFFHSGGVVGQTSDRRLVPEGVFQQASKYHAGGLVAHKQPMPGLAAHEVPAILMGGPKGVREEVLHAADPRHRDNLKPEVAKALFSSMGIESNKPSMLDRMQVAGARELGGPVSANSLYRVNERGPELLSIAGKEYLMTGNQGGDVKSGPTGAGDTHIHNNISVAMPQGGSRQTAIQFGAEVARQLSASARRNGKHV